MVVTDQQEFIVHSLVEGNKIDLTNSTQVVRNMLSGNNTCLRNVSVINVIDKCTDLKACISQQKTVFGFLPISNLKRLRIIDALKANRIIFVNLIQ